MDPITRHLVRLAPASACLQQASAYLQQTSASHQQTSACLQGSCSSSRLFPGKLVEEGRRGLHLRKKTPGPHQPEEDLLWGLEARQGSRRESTTRTCLVARASKQDCSVEDSLVANGMPPVAQGSSLAPGDVPSAVPAPLQALPPLDFTLVMKFGGSSIATAERMRQVASLAVSFPDERPVLVLSAMGKTTNQLLALGERALQCGARASSLSGRPTTGVPRVEHLSELQAIRDLHVQSCLELGLECPGEVLELLEELQQLATGIALMGELTDRTRDYLVSFGERLSTRIFSAYLQSLGVDAVQVDAFNAGMLTTDEFNNADVIEEAYPAILQSMSLQFSGRPGAVPIFTGFLGKGKKTGAITTLGRGGSDLTATVVARALGLREAQVWKDVDGVLTCDPRICTRAKPIPRLTFEEASELAYFGAQVLHPQSMRPARESNLPVRVKNSYDPSAPGTLITATRDLREELLTCIVLKSHVTLLDIVSLRMLGQFGFLAKVFSIFEELGISVDVVATSEVSISLTLDPSKLWSRALIQQELDNMVDRLSGVASVKLLQGRAIISLIGNVEQSSAILERTFRVLKDHGTQVQMISQGASKVNISLVVDDDKAQQLVLLLHKEFFE